MRKTILTVILVFYFVPFIVSQNKTVKGKVVDIKTGLPLAFVNISTENENAGTISDIDGNFSIKIKETNIYLNISYLGYQPVKYIIDFNKESQLIKLKEQPYELEEVKIHPGVNPAHRIIKNAIENRKKNNPLNHKQFTYTSYDKMTITADINNKIEQDSLMIDSTEKKLKDYFERRYLFIMESITERKYMYPGLNQENVIATRVSGLKDPIIVFMISQLQSASFYDNEINIINNSYVNPISKGSISRYFFLIEDTLFNNNGDTTFIISFKPKLNKYFDGLKGFLYINSDGWAIQNVKAQPVKDTSKYIITIQQAYQKINDSVWFPKQLNTNILMKKFNLSYNHEKLNPIAEGTSYIQDINLNPGLRKRDFGLYEVEVEQEALKRDENYWNKYRTDSLSPKEVETYRYMDSIGEASNLERLLETTQTLMTGKIPLGPISIDMDKLIKYNIYEGFYLGIGLHTNRKFSKVVSFGGFVGYGFGDNTLKYGVDGGWNFHKPTESYIKLAAYYQVIESGGVTFRSDKDREWNPENFGDFFIKRKNLTQGYEADYSFRVRAFRDFKWNVGFIVQDKTAYGDYIFTPFDQTNLPQKYSFTMATFEFRYAFREKIIKTTRNTMSLGSKYPIVLFKYTQGLKNVIHADFKFSKFDLRVTGKNETKYYGDFLWTLNLGYVKGTIPATDLYATRGTYRVFTLYAPNTFGTMLTNEFLSDRYASLFLTWDFKDLLVNLSRWKPRLLLLTNMAIGDIKNPQQHLNYGFKIMNKGFFESGFIIRKLLDLKFVDFGGGIMYRYGPYSFNKTGDNFAYKFSIYYGFN
jgi:hypothetical protein